MKKITLLLALVCILFTACTAGGNQEENKNENITKIMPLASTLDINNLTDCTVAVSLNKGDVYVDDAGIMQMKVTVYDYDLYDMIDISQLKEGDVIVIGKKDVIISSLERNSAGTVIINGGLDQGGYELVTNENGVFYETGYSDVKSYYSVGEATIRVSTEFKYFDKSDLDGEVKSYYPGDFLIEGSGIDYNFTPHNTSIVINDGQIIEMNRVYVP
jgi:ABC-type enterochelin transport system substrate-binding protein